MTKVEKYIYWEFGCINMFLFIVLSKKNNFLFYLESNKKFYSLECNWITHISIYGGVSARFSINKIGCETSHFINFGIAIKLHG